MLYMDQLLTQQLLAQIGEKTDDLRVARDRLMRELALIDAELKKLESAKEVFLSFTNPPVSSRPTVRHQTGLGVVVEGFVDGYRMASKRDRILSVADELLKDGFPRTTEEILAKLDEAGVGVSGSDEKTRLRNLSAYLSKAKAELRIESSKVGWVKRPMDEVSPHNEVRTLGPRLADLFVPRSTEEKDKDVKD